MLFGSDSVITVETVARDTSQLLVQYYTNLQNNKNIIENELLLNIQYKYF